MTVVGYCFKPINEYIDKVKHYSFILTSGFYAAGFWSSREY